ncbi:hypothetical protein ALC62_12336, partial [Cyphomyrmex costatus]
VVPVNRFPVGDINGRARVLSTGVVRPGVNLGHICTAHPRLVVGSWKARAR